MMQTKPTFLRDYCPPAFLVKTIDLCFVLGEIQTQVESHMAISRNVSDSKKESALVLNGQSLELVSIALDGHLLAENAYQRSETELVVPNVPDEFSLHIVTRIKPQENTSLRGLYVSRGIFCTQCEAEGFRRMTYFPDRPDVLAMYTTTIVADRTRYPILLSNGNKTAHKELPNNQHSVTWNDPFRKPSHLFALVAGDLACIQDEFLTQSHRKIELKIFLEKGHQNRCYHAMDSLRKAMRWDEQAYGREYDLDVFMIAVIDDFNMGAMENKGLNIFNAQTILADPNTATDADYDHITKVVGHEYFHNWTGNRVTCRDWFQLSLKEGLTVFREQEFSETIGSSMLERIDAVKQLRSLQFAEDAGPLAHPVQPDSYIEINNFYTTTVYEKGAELVRMIKLLLGTESFRKGMDLYFQRYDGQAVTIEDFLRSMEEAGAYDLSQFRLWYRQAGTPQLLVQYHYDAARKVFELRVKQSCPPTPGQSHKDPFYIPLSLALLEASGRAIPLQLKGEATSGAEQRVLIIKKEQEHFCFVDVPHAVTPSLLRGFSAPVKLVVDYRDEALSFLLHRDSDGFNRWDAAQQLATRIIMGRVASSGQQDQSEHLLIAAYKALLSERALVDQGLLSELLGLPSEAQLAEHMSIIDVDGIHRERRHLRTRIAQALREPLLETYHHCHSDQAYRFDASSQAQRRLKNICLAYLMPLRDASLHDLCLTQYNRADNLTDRISALSELVTHNIPQSAQLLDEFYEQWQDNTLVVCKWLAIQARAPLPDSLSRVQALIKHPAFDWKNPNKIRALIGSFCRENRVQFHQLSGAGYRFLSEQVRYLNQRNPQMAAGLLKPLTSWRLFDSTRRGLMREQLEQLLKTPNLSPDVYEIVSKSLA